MQACAVEGNQRTWTWASRVAVQAIAQIWTLKCMRYCGGSDDVEGTESGFRGMGTCHSTAATAHILRQSRATYRIPFPPCELAPTLHKRQHPSKALRHVASWRILNIDTVRTHTSIRYSSLPTPTPPPTLCHGTFANAHLRPAKPHCTKPSTRPRMPTQTPQHSKIHSSASSKTSAFRFFIIAPPLTAIPLQAETLLTTPFHSFSLFPALAGS